MEDILKNIKEDFSLDEIIKFQALLGKIRQTREVELTESKTLFKFTEDYLNMVRHTFSEKYLCSVRTTFNHLLKYFGEDYLMATIKVKDAENFKQYLMKSAPNGYPVYLRNLKAAFNRALLWDMVSVNPFAKIEIKKKQKGKPGFINRSELEIILEQVNNKTLQKLYLFAFYTGARLSECVFLKWKNVDLSEALVTIGDDEFITKNKKVRVIPMVDELKDLLVRVYKKSKDKNSYVFAKNGGFPYRREYVSKKFKQAVKNSKITKDIHFHSLRHSFASNLVLASVPITVVSELMGHSSIMVTQMYSHNDLTAMRSAIAKFN